MKKFFKMFLNQDSGDGKGGGDAGAGDGKDVSGDTQDKTKTETDTKTEPEKKYTDDQVNALIAKNSAKAMSKELEKLGLSADDLPKLAEMKKASQTQAEKDAEAIKQANEAAKKAAERADQAEARAEALALGIPAAKVDKFVKLAISGGYEGETIRDKIKAVIEEYKDIIETAGKGVSFGQVTEDQKGDPTQNLINEALAAAGIVVKK